MLRCPFSTEKKFSPLPEKRLPGMFVAKEWVEAGRLMSYGESLSDMYHRGAYFVDRILKGAKPADLL